MRPAVFAMVVPLLVVLGTILVGLRRDSFLPGDCPYYAATTLSLLHDGDFDLGNQLGIASRDDLKPHEGYFAVSPMDVVVPKHSTLLPIMSVPLVAIFGDYGFLITNMLIVMSVIAGMAALAGWNGPQGDTSRIAAIIVFLTSTMTFYCYNFSNDMLATALIVWCYAAAKNKNDFLVGVLAGLAVWSKVYAVVILLPVALFLLPMRWREIAKLIGGATLALLPMLIINHQLYGGPFVTGYDRDARVTAEGFRLTEHYSRFHQSLWLGLQRLLFDLHCGMIATAPLWFLFPAGLWLSRYQRWAWAVAIGAILNIVFFATYDEWNASQDGNRFLFPAVALGGALLAPLLRKFSRDPEALRRGAREAGSALPSAKPPGRG